MVNEQKIEELNRELDITRTAHMDAAVFGNIGTQRVCEEAYRNAADAYYTVKYAK